MIALALFLAGAGVPPQLLDEADAANMAHTNCAFAVEGAAHRAGLSPVDFERKLKTGCAAEERRLRSVSLRIFRARGDADPEGEVEDMIREGRRIMVEGYRKFPEQLRALEDLEKACRAQPDACRP